MDYSKYLKEIEDRDAFYLCGLDVISFGVMDYLEKHGKKVCGIIDKTISTPVRMFGTTFFPISWIEDKKIGNAGIIITAFKEKHRKQYAKLIEKMYGQENYIIVANATEIRIDISGVCNLRCPSCHVGNHSQQDFDYVNRGFMDIETFDRILNKIEREIPDNPAIYLFSLGEPLLNKNLPVMIEHIHKHGWMAILSSNLSVRCDLKSIMKAGPDVLKISVSGFTQEIYETTHKGGNIELVKRNMKSVKECIDQYHLATKVTVGYHVYTNNRGSEFANMKAYSEKLGFLFEPVEALFFNIFKRTGYTPFSKADEEFIYSYYSEPQKILEVPKSRGEEDTVCRNMRDKLFIDYNGNVMLCELLHKEGVYKNYLDVSYEEIQQWRQHHWICQRCKTYDMHLK